MPRLLLAGILGLALTGGQALTQETTNRIDVIRPDAPALAAHGDLPIGVRTLTMTNPGQIDILGITEGTTTLPTYDRPLTVEVWYPADGPAAPSPYMVYLRDGQTQFPLRGVATRDAAPAATGPYPLILISHGFPGNRYLMSHLGENLATKGYVVASIDHTDSTYRDKAAFGSTLVNRPLDQSFVLNEIARLTAGAGFLAGLVDTERTGLIGYSMGAYGAVITAGGGVTVASTEYAWGAPLGTLVRHVAGSETHEALMDPRIKAAMPIAPWGMNTGFWDAEGLAGLRIPLLFVAGGADDVSGYENGIKAIFEGAVNTDRYLLTFNHANHNAAAPMPAPAESYAPVESLDFIPFEHYADAVWDTVRMNNIAQHFATAWFGKHLKNDAGMDAYLDLIEIADDGVVALNEDGSRKPEHSYWEGFAPRTAKGLSLLHRTPR